LLLARQDLDADHVVRMGLPSAPHTHVHLSDGFNVYHGQVPKGPIIYTPWK